MSDDDSIELGDEACPKCLSHTYRKPCDYCDDDGYSEHDCGDDTCCCLLPEPNVECDICLGRGWHNWCPTCGWDLLEKRYLNGIDERSRNPSVGREGE